MDRYQQVPDTNLIYYKNSKWGLKMIMKTLVLLCLSVTTNSVDFAGTDWVNVHDALSRNSFLHAEIKCKYPETKIFVFRCGGIIGMYVDKEIISNDQFKLIRTYNFSIIEETWEILLDVEEQEFAPEPSIPAYEYI